MKSLLQKISRLGLFLFYILIFIWALWLVMNVARADFTLVSQLVDSSSQTRSAVIGLTQEVDLSSYVGSSVTAVRLKLSGSHTAFNFSLRVCDQTGFPLTNCGALLPANGSANLTGTPTVYTETLNTPETIQAGKFYFIQSGSIGGGQSVTYRGSGSDVYPGGRCGFETNGNACSIPDLYFEVIGAGSQPSAISITNPANGTSTVDFGLFQGTFTTSASTSNNYVRVNYGYSTSSMTFTDAEPQTLQSGGIGEDWNVQKTNQLETGRTIYAQATLLTFPGSELASSTIISFDLTTSGNPYFPTFTPTSTLQDLYTTCDTEDGFFAQSFCKMLQTAFIPDQAALDDFLDLKEALENKPPFGYFVSFAGAIDDLETAASSTIDLSELEGMDFFQTVRAALVWVFWFIFGFWVFNKFRHFKF